MTKLSTRIGAASGAVCIVAVFTGNGMALAGQSGATDGPDLLEDLSTELSAVNSTGLALEMFGWAALMMFLGYLYRVLRNAEGPDGWLAPVAFGSGVLMVSIKLGSVAPWVAAWYRRDDLTVESAQTLNDLTTALFIVSGWVTGLLVASAAGSALVSRVLPRWLAWSGLVIGVATLVAGTMGLLDPRSYSPLPFVAGLFWLLATSVILTIRLTRPVQDEFAAQTVPAGSATGQ